MGKLFQVLVGVTLLAGSSVETSEGRSRGYALGFQGAAPIASNKNGFIKKTDVGWDQVDTEVTVTAWVKFFGGQSGYVYSFNSGTESNWFQMQSVTSGWVLGMSMPSVNFTYIEEISRPDGWGHTAFVLGSGKVKTYYNGELVGEQDAPGSFMIEPMGLQLGAHTYNLHDSVIRAKAELAFHGAIDEFSLWSKALNQSEIKKLLENSMSKLEVEENAKSDLILYYDMEVDCGLSALRAGGLQSESCFLSGSNFIKNRGKAGSEYDLLLGSMNDEFGYGKFWTPVDAATASNDCQAGQPFDVPRPALSVRNRNLTAGDLDTPSVYFCTPNSWITLETLSGFLVDDVPTFGSLRDKIDGQEILKGQDASTAVFFCPSDMLEPVWFSFAQSTSIHIVHIWPYSPPTVVSKRLELNEDSSAQFVGSSGENFKSPRGPVEPVTVKLLSKPESGLFIVYYIDDWYLVDWFLENDASFYPSRDPNLLFEPDSEQFGNDFASFQFQVIGDESGLTSAPATITFDVLAVDDIPSSMDSKVEVGEDSEYTAITLSASDKEDGFVGVTIAQLPQKGSLYFKDPLTGNFQLIDASYNPYDVRQPISQYVDEVLKVSSLSGSGFLTGYHALNIIGRPQCYDQGDSDCGSDTRFVGDFTLVEGDMVKFDRLWDELNLPYIYVVGRVLKVYGTGEASTYDIQMLPMQKMDNSPENVARWMADPNFTLEKKKCYMVGDEFPMDCDESDYTTKIDTDLRKNDGIGNYIFLGVPRYGITEINNGGTTFKTRAYTKNNTVSVFFSSAYGDQYEVRDFRQSDLYESNSPPFTEFLELKFKEPVYPLDIEVGETRGAGSIVSVKVKAPDGRWQSVYSGYPLKDESVRTNGRDFEYFFTKPICRPSFKTDQVRLELDTSDQTGIADYNILDYVKLTGARDLQTAFLRFPDATVYYKPNKNAEGVDSFQFQATDCGGNPRRSALPSTVFVNITGTPDDPVPVVDFHGVDFPEKKGQYIVLPTDSFKIELRAAELDTSDSAVVRNLKTTGLTLVEENGKVAGKALFAQDGPVEFATTSFSAKNFTVIFDPCTSSDEKIAVISFSVVDKGQRTVDSRVEFLVQCGNLQKDFAIQALGSSDKTFAIVLGSIGVLISLGFAAFNFYFRSVRVVRFSSPMINLVILFGTMCVYGYIMSFGASPEQVCDFGSFVNSSYPSGFDLTCSASEEAQKCCRNAGITECTLRVWLLSIGMLVSFTPLVAKTYRIARIFNSKNMKRIVITDKTILLQCFAVTMVLILGLMLWTILAPASINFEVVSETFDLESQMRVVNLGTTCVAGKTFDTVVGILISLSVVVVFMGAYQAKSIWNVHIKQANDSRQIFFSIYNVLLLGTISIVLSFAINDYFPKFYLVTSMTWLLTTMTICLLFVPRVMEVAQGKDISTINSNSNSGGTFGSSQNQQMHTVATKIDFSFYPPSSFNPASTAGHSSEEVV